MNYPNTLLQFPYNSSEKLKLFIKLIYRNHTAMEIKWFLQKITFDFNFTSYPHVRNIFHMVTTRVMSSKSPLGLLHQQYNWSNHHAGKRNSHVTGTGARISYEKQRKQLRDWQKGMGEGGEHLKMWHTPSIWHETEWPSPKLRLQIKLPPYLKHYIFGCLIHQNHILCDFVYERVA